MSLCRFCRAPLTRTFLDLGLQPLANSYLTPEQLAAGNEPVFPLNTMVCDACFLVQADHAVPVLSYELGHHIVGVEPRAAAHDEIGRAHV